MRTRRNNKIQQHYVAQWLQKQMFIRANKNMFFFVEFDRSDPIETTISMNNLVTADHQRDDVVSSINSCQIQFRWQFSWLANNIGAIDPINWIRVEVRCVCVCVCVCCLQWNCVCTMTLLLSRQMNLLKQELHQFCAFELDSQLNVHVMQMCGWWWEKVFQLEFYFVQFINHNTYYVWRNFRIKMWHYSIFVLYRQSSCCSENQFHWLLYHNEQNQLN